MTDLAAGPSFAEIELEHLRALVRQADAAITAADEAARGGAQEPAESARAVKGFALVREATTQQ